MTKTQFSSKLLSLSFAYRVLAISLGLLMIPLLILSFYLWVQEIQIGIFSPIIFSLILIVLLGAAITLFLIFKMAKPLKQLRQVISYIETQTDLFPKKLPQFPGLDLAVHFIPSKDVSGDFYDLFMTSNNQLLIVMADVSGKGMSACLYAFLVRSILRAISFNEKNLQEAIELTNCFFSLDTAESGYFMTAWIGLYDPTSKVLEYSCCGHPPALLLHANGSVEELGNLGGVLGVRELQQVKTRSISFFSEEILLLYTDGLIEARNGRNEMYGKERLIKEMKTVSHSNARELVNGIIQDVEMHNAGKLAQDDLTLLALRVIK